MATFSRELLSASVNGKPIKIVQTATPGTLIHTALTSSEGFDEIYMWLTNTSNAAVAVTVEFGGATAPDFHLVSVYSLPKRSAPIPIATGQVLQNGLTLKVFADTANVITASGFINRIS